MPTATAPVQELRITDQLDPALDWSTFAFTSISYGERVLPISTKPGILEYAAQDQPPIAVIAGTTEGDMLIDIVAKVNIQTGIVEWYLKTIDSATNDFPLDALAGFLPPEDGSGRGQGYVTFSIKPKRDVAMGTVVKNKATIIFDTNEPIATNEVANLVGEAVDLVLLAEGSPQTIAGETATITYTVINDGPDHAADVNFVLNAPAGVSLLSIVPTQGACNGNQCSLGVINNDNRTKLIAQINTTAAITTFVSAASVTSNKIELNQVDNNVQSVLNLTMPPVPPLSVPTLLMPDDNLTVAEGAQLTYQWQAVPSAASYTFLQTLNPDGGSPTVNQATIAEASYTDQQPLIPGKYSWEVKAISPTGIESAANRRYFSVAPHSPLALQASSPTCQEIVLTWQDNSSYEEGYHIYRDGNKVNEVAKLEGGNGEYRDTGLAGSTTYVYKVVAYHTVAALEGITISTATPICEVQPPPTHAIFLPLVTK